MTSNVNQDDAAAGSDIAREDELLELLYWFEGEGFGGVASIVAPMDEAAVLEGSELPTEKSLLPPSHSTSAPTCRKWKPFWPPSTPTTTCRTCSWDWRVSR